MSTEPIKKRVTVIGDGMVGKTALLTRYSKGTYDADYLPTVYDNTRKHVTIDGIPYVLDLWDTAGQEVYQHLRNISYGKTEIFLLCFSIGNEASSSNITAKWIPEIKPYLKEGATVMLVGTMSDLRSTQVVTSSYQEGEKLKEDIKAMDYIECSAKADENVELVFEEAVRKTVELKQKSRKICALI